MLNLIDETTNMIEEFKQSKRGTLRVGASHAPIYSILPSTLKKYMHDYPNIDINLIVDTAPIILNKIKDNVFKKIHLLSQWIKDILWLQKQIFH